MHALLLLLSVIEVSYFSFPANIIFAPLRLCMSCLLVNIMQLSLCDSQMTCRLSSPKSAAVSVLFVDCPFTQIATQEKWATTTKGRCSDAKTGTNGIVSLLRIHTAVRMLNECSWRGNGQMSCNGKRVNVWPSHV